MSTAAARDVGPEEREVRQRCVLLLRAVNVSGRNRVPMAQLRALLSERLGLGDVATYIASGNVICPDPGDAAARADLCERVRLLIAGEFGVDTPVILRTRGQLLDALDRNPFPDAAHDKLLHVMFLAGPPAGGAEEALAARLVPGERIALYGEDLWIDYASSGVHGTKLTKSVLDRALGVAGTARNVRTVRTLAERIA